MYSSHISLCLLSFVYEQIEHGATNTGHLTFDRIVIEARSYYTYNSLNSKTALWTEWHHQLPGLSIYTCDKLSETKPISIYVHFWALDTHLEDGAFCPLPHTWDGDESVPPRFHHFVIREMNTKSSNSMIFDGAFPNYHRFFSVFSQDL